MKLENSRRSFLKASLLGGAVIANPISKALSNACIITPAQTPGPFYPGESQFHNDNDLTQIPGHTVKASGKVVYIKGRVLDPSCSPVKNANVEIWQACVSGRYNNPNDPNTAP